jgi:two-component system sensor histidine kinase KdpD
LLEALAHQTALSIERVRFVEEIDRAVRAEEIARLRSALLNSVSHDLGTPLAVIRSSAEVLRDRGMADLGDRVPQIIADIIEECDTLNRFIGNLLNMTKLASGAITPNFDMHDLRDIVAIAIKLARNVVTHHRVELRLDPQVPPVRVDAVLLEQAVFNLLDNAAKYSPQGTTIRIESFAEAESAYLRITDQGRGVRPEDVEHICDVLSVGQGSGSSKRYGSGVGNCARVRPSNEWKAHSVK